MTEPDGMVMIETESEVEAYVYQGIFAEAGILAQVRSVDDFVLTNIVRQVALPRFHLVVPSTQAAEARAVLAEHQRQLPDDTETESAGRPAAPRAILIIGRLLIWLLLAAIVLIPLILSLR